MTVILRFVGDQAIAHVQMSMAGVFDRLPDLKICWSETQAGWLAHAMAQMDHNFECNSYLAEKDYGARRNDSDRHDEKQTLIASQPEKQSEHQE